MDTVKFAPVKGRRLSSEVEHAIKDLILVGRIRPGDKLPAEKELAAQFAVSATTVREALRGLETLGMLVKKKGKNGGTVVTGMRSAPVKDILYTFMSTNRVSPEDICQLREILEPAAAAIAAEKINQGTLARLDDNVRYCEQRLRISRDGLSERELFEIEQTNIEFHRTIAEASGNPALVMTIDWLADYLLTMKRTVAMPNIEFTRAFVKEHRAIWNLLNEHNSEGVREQMQHHIRWVAEYMRNARTGRNSASFEAPGVRK